MLKGQKKQLPGEEGSEPATKKMKVEAESKDSVFRCDDEMFLPGFPSYFVRTCLVTYSVKDW